MDFFVWQGRRRERRREFWQHAASLCRGAHLQAHTHPARVGQHAARLRSGTGLPAGARCKRERSRALPLTTIPTQPVEKDAVSWRVMGWDWYRAPCHANPMHRMAAKAMQFSPCGRDTEQSVRSLTAEPHPIRGAAVPPSLNRLIARATKNFFSIGKTQCGTRLHAYTTSGMRS